MDWQIAGARQDAIAELSNSAKCQSDVDWGEPWGFFTEKGQNLDEACDWISKVLPLCPKVDEDLSKFSFEKLGNKQAEAYAEIIERLC